MAVSADVKYPDADIVQFARNVPLPRRGGLQFHVHNSYEANSRGFPVKEVRGKGLMTGIEFNYPIKELRSKLLKDHKIFTGTSSNPNVLRLLPPLGGGEKEINLFAEKLNKVIEDETIHFSS